MGDRKMNKIIKFLKPNETQKVFLVVWTIILIIVCGALIANIGKHYSGSKRDYIGGPNYSVEGETTFNDVLLSLLIVISLSVVMYFLVGLEPIQEDKKR